MKPNPNPHHLTPWQIALVVIVVLGGILAGTFFTLRFQGPRPPHRPTALGHQAPAPARVPPASTASMVLIPASVFRMGAGDGASDERPARDVTLDAFWMDRTEVTNAEFARFVAASGYVTTAEKPPNTGLGLKELGDTFSGRPGSFILERTLDGASSNPLRWRWVEGASWRHPEGPGSNITNRENHPVVHVSWLDATAYASWAKKRLPTEAEWEYAARAGVTAGADLSKNPVGVGTTGAAANFWQSTPAAGTMADTFAGIAPVGRFTTNRFGLFDLAGNAAEWCADWYRADYFTHAPAKNPPGPEASLDPAEPAVAKKVVRGGSYLTSDPAEWRLTARMKRSPYVSYSDVGFRCVRSVK